MDTQGASFDLGHDKKLMEFLDKEIQFNLSLTNFGTGIIDVPVKILEKAINIRKKINLNDETVARLKSDIEDAKSNKEEFVSYCCF